MIRRHHRLDEFEDEQRHRPVDYERNLQIYEGLWKEAFELGRLGPVTLEGIETDIECARVINRLPAKRPAIRSHVPGRRGS